MPAVPPRPNLQLGDEATPHCRLRGPVVGWVPHLSEGRAARATALNGVGAPTRVRIGPARGRRARTLAQSVFIAAVGQLFGVQSLDLQELVLPYERPLRGTV